MEKQKRIKIDKLSYGGAGIGASDGKIVFVKRGLPGDELEVIVRKDKKNYAVAEVLNIITPSSSRVEPGCPVFGECGGCQWQDLEYTCQLAEKQNIVVESIERLGKIDVHGVQPVVPSPLEYGYRSRIVLSLVKNGDGFSVCFFEEGSKRKIPIDYCPVANQQVNECIRKVSRFFSTSKQLPGTPGKVYIVSGDNNAGITVLFRNKKSKFKMNLDPDSLSLTGKKETEVGFKMWNKHFISVPSLFMQSNTGVSSLMTDTLKQWVTDCGAENVLDLYCGFGNFTIPVSDIADSTTGVDSNSLAINYARKNAYMNDTGNTVFITDNADSYLRTNKAYFDTVILDPPRDGAKVCAGLLSKMKPANIIYISCNPATLARDIAGLYSSGYRIRQVKPFDMFPHTYHIECMVLLGKT